MNGKTSTTHPAWCDRVHAESWPVHCLDLGEVTADGLELAVSLVDYAATGAGPKVSLALHDPDNTTVIDLHPADAQTLAALLDEAKAHLDMPPATPNVAMVLAAAPMAAPVDPELEERPDRADAFQARLAVAAEALTAVLEDPQLGTYQPQRTALLEALDWLEIESTCGDCVTGRCHWGAQRSHDSIAAAQADTQYLDAVYGRCGCARHEVSVQARARRARLTAAGIRPGQDPA